MMAIFVEYILSAYSVLIITLRSYAVLGYLFVFHRCCDVFFTHLTMYISISDLIEASTTRMSLQLECYLVTLCTCPQRNFYNLHLATSSCIFLRSIICLIHCFMRSVECHLT